MKVTVTPYSFNAAARTVTFTGYAAIQLHRVISVVNTTRSVVIFDAANPTKRGTVATNVLTLTFDTSGHSNSDDLIITYEDPEMASNVVAGQLSIAVTGTAVQLPSNAITKFFMVTNHSNNRVTLGPSTVNNTANGSGNGFVLEPLSSAALQVDNTADLWLNGTAGDWISFIGS